MYKTLTISGKEYKMEYTVEASLYSECTEKLVDFISKMAITQSVGSISESAPEDEKEKAYKSAIKEGISGISNLPTIAMHLWYAGFMEYHGAEGIEDHSVSSMADAKNLYRAYAKENEENTFFDILGICMEQMDADGFFHRIGLDQMLNSNPEPKKPQDHKRKKASAK